MKRGKDLNRFKGCLFGGAVGDALGYAVEFLNAEQIREQYGESGILNMELVNGKACISDDTQMTLFTANGILNAETKARLWLDERPLERHLHDAYMDWHRTQRFGRIPSGAKISCWIYNVPALHSVRAPGGTCLRSLAGGLLGTMEHPINSSKGCGGVMRCAPIGLFYDPSLTPIETVDTYGARSAALTHGHPLGYLSAAAMVHIVNRCVYGDFANADTLYDIAADCIRSIKETFRSNPKIDRLPDILQRAIDLSCESIPDAIAIAQLGEGWVAEEAIAIALYCALKYSDDFGKAVIASVNHSGDSDSTGSLTGSILGAYLGYDRIPASFLESLELFDVIRTLCEDLFTLAGTRDDAVCLAESWQRKYVKADYRI